MTAPAKITAADVAAFCEAHGRADLADFVRTIKPNNGGRKPKRDADGFTEHNKELARLWIEMQDRIDGGEDEGDVIEDTKRRSGHPYEFLCDLLALYGRPEVRKILKHWGRIR